MNNDNDFFPNSDYEIADTSNYTKFPVGETKFRVLSSAVIGFEYFKESDNSPVRSKEPFEERPTDIKGDIKEFWAFIVYNYKAKRVQIAEISKKSLKEQMMNYIKNPDWGSPKNYDVTVSRKGTGMNDTKYTIVCSPPKPTDASILAQFKSMKIDLNALFAGMDPFQTDK